MTYVWNVETDADNGSNLKVQIIQDLNRIIQDDWEYNQPEPKGIERDLRTLNKLFALIEFANKVSKFTNQTVYEK